MNDSVLLLFQMSNRNVLLQYITRWFIIDHRHNDSVLLLFQMSNRDVLLQYITRWFIIDHRHNEIEQLKHGLSYMGFLDIIKSKTWPQLHGVSRYN
jgi:phage shock protein PspC (stress-responsive transcriptional regulator)